MSTEETLVTKERAVYCSGIQYPFDHPKIYLEIDPSSDSVICPYCSKKFIYTAE